MTSKDTANVDIKDASKVDKSKVISAIYYDPSAFGTVAQTYKEAKAKEPTIKYNDVVEWFKQNVERKTQLKGYNSYVASARRDEYQIDLFFLSDLEDQREKIGMAAIDIFTRKATVVVVKSKQLADVLAGVMECCTNLGGYPKMIYSDEEPSLTSKEVIDFLQKEKGVRMITTRTHAGYVERFIRTFKSMLYKRIEASKDPNPQWHDFIYPILLTYNNKLVHSTTGMTPSQAEKPDNQLTAKLTMDMKAKRDRKYPEIDVGDRVKIYKKKKPGFQKERVSVWSAISYTVKQIETFMGQSFYHLEGMGRTFTRHELLRV